MTQVGATTLIFCTLGRYKYFTYYPLTSLPSYLYLKNKELITKQRAWPYIPSANTIQKATSQAGKRFKAPKKKAQETIYSTQAIIPNIMILEYS